MAIETYHPIPEEFWPAVDEVVRFIVEDRLLSRPFQPDQFHDFPCEVVYDLADWTPYRVTGLPNSRCEVEWQDVRLNTESEGMRLCYLSEEKYPVIWSAEHTEKLNELYFFLRPIIETQLRNMLPNCDPSDDIMEIDLHIDLVIGSRSMIGAGHNHLMEEKLFNVYKAYGYPCGWIGPFPEGRLVVFSRK